MLLRRLAIERMLYFAAGFNLAVVIMVISLVCAVLVCCWRRDRAVRRQRLLEYEGQYSYGTVAGEINYVRIISLLTRRWPSLQIKTAHTVATIMESFPYQIFLPPPPPNMSLDLGNSQIEYYINE